MSEKHLPFVTATVLKVTKMDAVYMRHNLRPLMNIGDKVEISMTINEGIIYIEFYNKEGTLSDDHQVFGSLPDFLSRYETNTRFVLIEKTSNNIWDEMVPDFVYVNND